MLHQVDCSIEFERTGEMWKKKNKEEEKDVKAGTVFNESKRIVCVAGEHEMRMEDETRTEDREWGETGRLFEADHFSFALLMHLIHPLSLILISLL